MANSPIMDDEDDYLRAELAKEEPIGEIGEHMQTGGFRFWPAPKQYIMKGTKLYLRPSEPSQSTPSAESAPPPMTMLDKALAQCDSEDGAWPADPSPATPPSMDALFDGSDAHLLPDTPPSESAARVIEPFIVKHYSAEERPSIKGNGFDGLEIGDDRDDAERFIAFVNALIAREATGGKP